MRAPYKQTAVRPVWRIATCLSMLALVAACGYKGPLYMPPPPAPDEALVAPPASGVLAPASSGTAGDTAAPQPLPVK